MKNVNKNADIIIIDRSKALIEDFIEKFQKINIKAKGAVSSVTGLKLIYEYKPKIVILDSVIDEINGFDLSMYIKNDKNLQNIVIIVYSSVEDSRNLIFKENSGADFIINKEAGNIDDIVNRAKEILKQTKVEYSITNRCPENLEIQCFIENLHEKNLIKSKINEDLFNAVAMAKDNENLIENIYDILFKYFNINALSLIFNNNNTFYNYQKFSTKLMDQDRKNIDIKTKETFLKENTSLNTKKVTIKTKIFKNVVNNYINSSTKERRVYLIRLKDISIPLIIEYSINIEEEKMLLTYVLDNFKLILEQFFNHEKNKLYAFDLKNNFKKFLPEKIIEDLLKKKNEESLMTGEKRNIYVLFSHIKNFSFIEKNNSAFDVVNFLNNHFTIFSRSIKKYGGEINKYIEDAVFAMFGAPESYENNSDRALRAAIEILLRINGTTSLNIKTKNGEYKIGIGIHKGDAIIGNIGSKDNFDYTAIGDTVNLAARLESLNKYYHTDILISEEVYREAIKVSSPLFFREVDTIRVKGKEKPVTIYSVELLNNYTDEFLSLYNKGLKMFKLSNWNLAYDFFYEAGKIIENDRIIEIYMERISEFINNPPDNWDGVYKMTFK